MPLQAVVVGLLSQPELRAAVDLGSSRFRMVIARYSHGHLIIIDRLLERLLFNLLVAINMAG